MVPKLVQLLMVTHTCDNNNNTSVSLVRVLPSAVMQSQRKQHQRILRTKAQEHSGNLSEQDPRELEHVTRVTIAKKLSKKNLQAKSPLRFTNKYRAVPSSSDLSERRVRWLVPQTGTEVYNRQGSLALYFDLPTHQPTDLPTYRLTERPTMHLDRRFDA